MKPTCLHVLRADFDRDEGEDPEYKPARPYRDELDLEVRMTSITSISSKTMLCQWLVFKMFSPL